MTNNDNTKCPCGNQIDIETHPFCRPCASIEADKRREDMPSSPDNSAAEWRRAALR